MDIAVLFGADSQRATKELSESLDFEIELAKIQEEDPLEMNYVKVLKKLYDAFPNIPWKENDTAVAYSQKKLDKLNTLLDKTPKR